MKMRKPLVFLIIAVLLFAVAIIYFDTRLLDSVKQTSQEQDDSQTDGAGNQQQNDAGQENNTALDDDNTETQSTDDENNDQDTLKVSENVTVSFNTPEYAMEMKLCEDADQKTYISLRYYMNGASVINELDEGQIPELASIFESRGDAKKDGNEQNGQKSDQDMINKPYGIGQALLNPVCNQIYFLVNGAQMDAEYVQGSFYVVDLIDLSVKKLFSYPAKYGEMSFNKNYSMLAFSFEDPPTMSVYQENELVEVFDCKNGEFMIRGSRKPDMSLIGSNSDPGYIFDYTFTQWHTSEVIKLKQAVRLKEDADAEPVRSEVLYDISKNLLLNMDGSEFDIASFYNDNGDADVPNGNGSVDTQGDSNDNGQSGDSGIEETVLFEAKPSKLLMNFYSCLGSQNNYPIAMKMLDDNFILRLEMLEQFGVHMIHKKDIDAEYNGDNASMYSEFLKAAKFDKIVSEEIFDDGSALIKYYHRLGLNGNEMVSQLMSARLKMQDDRWVITLIEDGTE